MIPNGVFFYFNETYNWIQKKATCIFLLGTSHLRVRFGDPILGSLFVLGKVGLQSSSQDEGGNQDGSGEGAMVSIKLCIFNWLAFSLPKFPDILIIAWNPGMVPNELRDLIDGKKKPFQSSRCLCGRLLWASLFHSFLFFGRKRRWLIEQRGRTGRFKSFPFGRSFWHGILHDFRRTKWIKAWVSKMEDL